MHTHTRKQRTFARGHRRVFVRIRRPRRRLVRGARDGVALDPISLGELEAVGALVADLVALVDGSGERLVQLQVLPVDVRSRARDACSGNQSTRAFGPSSDSAHVFT